ncbi:MAG: hypothetical protein M3Y72_07545 [Acidobacteriota bacterium]|nr:hypothetical protein [Acidobacteriota bacterium]
MRLQTLCYVVAVLTILPPSPAHADVVLNFFSSSTYNANTSIMNAALGITGYRIYDFESTPMPGLSIALSGGVPATTWTSLPVLFDENAFSPTVNQAWDGTHSATNDINNQLPNPSVDPFVADLTTFTYSSGAHSIGLGLSNFQSLDPASPEFPITNHELFVNGVNMGVLENLAGSDWSPGWRRNAYLRVDATDSYITSIGFEDLQRGGSPDFLMFDHLAVQTPVPEPRALALVGTVLILIKLIAARRARSPFH